MDVNEHVEYKRELILKKLRSKSFNALVLDLGLKYIHCIRNSQHEEKELVIHCKHSVTL